MSARWTTGVGRRSIAVVAAGLATVSAVMGSAATSAAARPAPAPAVVITVSSVFTPSISVPNTPGAAAPYVVQDVPFTVAATSNAPLSANKSTPVVLTVTSGPDAGRVTAATEVPAGATSWQFENVVLPTPDNGVTVRVAVNDRRSEVVPGTRTFDVLKTSASAPANSQLTGFGGGGGPGVACNPTAEDPICGDLILPESHGVLSNQLVSQGSCDGLCNAAGSFLQALVEVDPTVYNANNPIELLAKCDKSLCKGKGIQSYSAYVQLTPSDPVVAAPACTAKGVITQGKFCTDYRQSTRDNAGDLYLMVLFAEDAKVILR